MAENTEYASSSVEAGHNALKTKEPLNERADVSKIWLCGRNYTKDEIELMLEMWSVLASIEKLRDPDKKDTAEANWFELAKALFT